MSGQGGGVGGHVPAALAKQHAGRVVLGDVEDPDLAELLSVDHVQPLPPGDGRPGIALGPAGISHGPIDVHQALGHGDSHHGLGDRLGDRPGDQRGVRAEPGRVALQHQAAALHDDHGAGLAEQGVLLADDRQQRFQRWPGDPRGQRSGRPLLGGPGNVRVLRRQGPQGSRRGRGRARCDEGQQRSQRNSQAQQPPAGWAPRYHP